MARNCLIGHTGFVGQNLSEQRGFDEFYNSSNAHKMSGEYDEVICCAAPAVKWWANENPEEDKKNIKKLTENLTNILCQKFILISTIDVYGSKSNNYELSNGYQIDEAYGKNRRWLEEFVSHNFKNHTVVRLPGLFGKGLKKNIIYDLINKNRIEYINLDDQFQWYYLDDLARDIARVGDSITEVNFFTEPISNKEIVESFFPDFINQLKKEKSSLRYDNKSLYFDNGYMYNKDEILLKLNAFLLYNKKDMSGEKSVDKTSEK
jgi:dTDP-4-dehydrorhamnose reductase